MNHAAGAIVLSAVLAGPALADPVLQITSYAYTLHSDTHTASFELVFNRAPDFLHADTFGRQADAFWFDMDTDMNASTGLNAYWYGEPLGIERRISAYEVWNTGGLVVHDQAYGPPLGSLSYSLVDTTVRFDADYALLALPDNAPGIYYAINVMHFGGTTQVLEVVPIPPAAAVGLPSLLALGLWNARRQARKHV